MHTKPVEKSWPVGSIAVADLCEMHPLTGDRGNPGAERMVGTQERYQRAVSKGSCKGSAMGRAWVSKSDRRGCAVLTRLPSRSLHLSEPLFPSV